MKLLKLWIVILSLPVIISACATGQPSTDHALPLSITASLKNSAPFEMVLTETECIVTFSEGHLLYGTQLRFDETGGIATVGGFARDVDLSLFPAQKALITALKGLCDKSIPKAENELQTSYTIDKMSIIVYYDEDKRTVKTIETEENGRRFEFDIAQLEAYEIQSDSAG